MGRLQTADHLVAEAASVCHLCIVVVVVLF